MIVWEAVLNDAGVTVEAVDADHVRLILGRQEKTLRLRRFPELMPSRVPWRAPGETGLLVVPRATQRTVDAAAVEGWNIVTDAGLYSVRVGRHTIASRPLVDDSPTRVRSWTLFLLVRQLLAGPPAPIRAFAAMIDRPPPQMSLVFRTLTDSGVVERGDDGYGPTDWWWLLEWWLTYYPGPGLDITYWASPKDLTTQARDVVAKLGPDQAAVSGDVGADLLAPWREPTLAVVYAKQDVLLGDIGFRLVGNAQKATMAVCVPDDPGVWLRHPWVVDGLPLADPAQIMCDVADGPEPDRSEAVDRLVEALTSRHLAAWRAAFGRSQP